MGSGVAYAEIHNLTNDMVLLVARLNDGELSIAEVAARVSAVLGTLVQQAEM